MESLSKVILASPRVVMLFGDFFGDFSLSRVACGRSGRSRRVRNIALRSFLPLPKTAPYNFRHHLSASFPSVSLCGTITPDVAVYARFGEQGVARMEQRAFRSRRDPRGVARDSSR